MCTATLLLAAFVAAACGPGGATRGPSTPQLPNAPTTANPAFSPTPIPSSAIPQTSDGSLQY
jgi:hypothetical protein